MKKVRICLLGAGRAGEVHGDAYKWSIPESEIVAIIDENKDNLDRLGKKYCIDNNLFTDLESALNTVSIDAVVITTPTFTHSEYVIRSANKGINVFCEKPMAITADDCDKMITACKDNDVILQIGFMRRFDKGFVHAKELIDNNVIGKPLIIKTNTRGPGLPGKWALDIKNSNGLLAEVNSHDFDTVRWLSESEFNIIHALADNFKSPDIGKEHKDFYDTAIVSGKMQNGVLFLIDGVCPCDYGYDARAEVIGSMGTMFIGQLYNGESITCTRENGIVAPQILSWRVRFKDAYIAEDRHFVECIKEDKQPRITGYDGKQTVIAAIESNKSIFSGEQIIINS